MGWGDELIVTGQVRELQVRDPRRVRIVYEKGRWHEAWHHNPRIARPDEAGDFQILNPRQNWLRPYIAHKTASRWTWRAWQPPRGELYFTEAEQAFGARHAGRVIVEPHIKPGASPNKQWGGDRWQRLAQALRRRGLAVAQLGPPGTPRLPDAEFIETRSMRQAAAVIAQARAAVLPEGGLHHVAAAVGCPAVVIFGGFISPEVTGYRAPQARQRALFVQDAAHPLGCGQRLACPHCAAALRQITVEQVLDALEGVLHETAPGHLAA